MESAIELSNLTKSFSNGNHGVVDLSFRLEQGEAGVLFGCHGAGKSTLLRLLSAAIAPTSGTIRLFGNSNWQQEQRRIGYVPHQAVYLGNLSIAETLRYFSRAFGSLQSLHELAASVNLDLTLSKSVRRQSIGNQRKLNLAIALLGSPDLLLLDEPFLGLDTNESNQLTEILSMLHKSRAITLLMTSQHYSHVSHIATRYGILRQGKLVAQFSPEQLLEDCERCIKIRTPHVSKTIPILQQSFPQYEVLADDLLRVFGALDRSAELNAQLVSAGIAVSEIWIAGTPPEQYLSQWMGGDPID
ncbi:ATP-binding cassette domain-containing protein [Paenibacillus sp. NEAU-GSW1]|uniref:ATP-binding cassette domain-containing protein n=1 Tax=Paenibacillus sp. NEAU-GSW1 TaxID=2682486 RepID=UPI0012E18586|nr:ABC transporter ATP-binding protein [Paenibacillus sp. NEAU-GSW1]MUT65159.1 ATP-binding cassette domain-containing protein [Paenibacillus sp. NEAU-GSW1]